MDFNQDVCNERADVYILCSPRNNKASSINACTGTIGVRTATKSLTSSNIPDLESRGAIVVSATPCTSSYTTSSNTATDCISNDDSFTRLLIRCPIPLLSY